MSATNRHNVENRRDADFYPTPITSITALLNYLDLNEYGNNVLDPGAGNGNICTIMKSKYPNKHLTGIELRREERNALLSCCDEVIIDNFLTKDFGETKYNIIIGNPPYTLGIEFVKKSLSLLSENGILIFLLRTAFLESRKRYEFWEQNPVTGLLTLSKRPSFTGAGTDATSYSWFIWDKTKNTQYINVLKNF